MGLVCKKPFGFPLRYYHGNLKQHAQVKRLAYRANLQKACTLSSEEWWAEASLGLSFCSDRYEDNRYNTISGRRKYL